MGSHSHGAQRSAGSTVVPDRPNRLQLVIVGVVFVATVVGLLLTWPRDRPQRDLGPVSYVSGHVEATVSRPCSGDQSSGSGSSSAQLCSVATVRVTSGPDRGALRELTFVQGAADPRLRAGDDVSLARVLRPDGAADYSFDDIRRGVPLLVLAVLFVLVALVVGRRQGILAVVSLAATFVVLVGYLLPALLDGRSPLAVGLVGCAAIVLFSLPLVHGWSGRCFTAMIGTLCGLVLCAGLAAVFLLFTRLTGLTTEENFILQGFTGADTVRGLVLCGAIVGSLGVLNDVTITQASAMREVADADAGVSRLTLFTAGMRVGRDHIGSTIYTLVLAYAGTALPTLLLLSSGGRSVLDVLTGDAVATEVVRTLSGSIALICTVPVTTALAAAWLRPGVARQTAVQPAS